MAPVRCRTAENVDSHYISLTQQQFIVFLSADKKVLDHCDIFFVFLSKKIYCVLFTLHYYYTSLKVSVMI